MTEELPEQFIEGLRLFNEEEFFECHDVLEELWAETIGDEQRFYQGLIQAAVALFHFCNDNFGGARKMYATAREKLEPYAPLYKGVDLEKFLAEFKHCFADLLHVTDGYPSHAVLHDDRIPKIILSDPDLER